jgi:hypothetical protein
LKRFFKSILILCICSLFSLEMLTPRSICLRYSSLFLMNCVRRPSQSTAACSSSSLWTIRPASIRRCGPCCLAWILGRCLSCSGISPSAFSSSPSFNPPRFPFSLPLLLLCFPEYPHPHQPRLLPPTQIPWSVCTSGLCNLIGAMPHGSP